MDTVRITLDVKTDIIAPQLIAFLICALQYMPTQFKLEGYEVHNVTHSSSYKG